MLLAADRRVAPAPLGRVHVPVGPLDLRVVHVLGEPHGDWKGERGLVTIEVMRRHLPTDLRRYQCLICGPTPMIRLFERNLRALGVPHRRMQSEIFDLA